MAHAIEYKCSTCHREVGKLNLKVKRVQFKEMGKGGAVIKTRTVAWLCVVPADDGGPSCLAKDEDYQRPSFDAAPGMAGTSA